MKKGDIFDYKGTSAVCIDVYRNSQKKVFVCYGAHELFTLESKYTQTKSYNPVWGSFRYHITESAPKFGRKLLRCPVVIDILDGILK